MSVAVGLFVSSVLFLPVVAILVNVDPHPLWWYVLGVLIAGCAMAYERSQRINRERIVEEVYSRSLSHIATYD